MRAGKTLAWFLGLAMGVFALGVVSPAGAEPPQAGAQDPAAATTWCEKGERLLTQAKDAATVTGEWCADNLSPAAVA